MRQIMQRIWRVAWGKIHPSWVVLMAVIGVVAGVALAVLFGVQMPGSVWWLACGIVMIVAGLVRPTWLMMLLPLIGGMLVAQWRVSFDTAGREYLEALSGETLTISGDVVEDPDMSEEKTALRLGDLVVGEQTVAGVMYVQLPRTDKVQRSDRVTVKGKLGEGFGTFAATMFRPQVLAIERPEPGDVPLKIRNGFAAEVQKTIPAPEVDLGLGYLLGVKNSLPEDVSEALKTVGLTHIVVASGANLAILVGAARKIFGRVSRWCGLIVAVVLVAVFVGMVGLTASMTRAAIVTILSLVAWYVGRKFQPGRLLLVVAAVTLLYNPMYLLDLGWGLSFAAFAGLLMVGPRMTEFFYGEKEPNFIMAVLVETLAANLLCLPLLLYTFGQVSIISLLANLLIVPTIPAVMLLALLTGVLSFIPMVAGWVGTTATWILDFHLYIVDLLGAQKIFLVQIPQGQLWVFLIYVPVVAVIGFSEWRKWRKRRRLFNGDGFG